MHLLSMEILKQYKKIAKTVVIDEPNVTKDKGLLKQAEKVLGRAPKFVLPDQDIVTQGYGLSFEEERDHTLAYLKEAPSLRVPYNEFVIEVTFTNGTQFQSPRDVVSTVNEVVMVVWEEKSALRSVVFKKSKVLTPSKERKSVPYSHWACLTNDFIIKLPHYEPVLTIQSNDEFEKGTAANLLIIKTLVSYLEAENITVEKPSLENKKTLARMVGMKLPGLDYHVLTLDPNKPNVGVRGTTGGTGGPKAEHERRGHWRTLHKSGKRVWVKASIINKGKSSRRVIKDYLVKGPQETTGLGADK